MRHFAIGPVFAVWVIAAQAAPVLAQEYIPVAAPSARSEAIAKLKNLGVPGISSAGSQSDPFKCANPPALSELTTKITSTSMTASTAAKLGFPVGGIAANANTRVLVQDWTRSKPCLSTDGKTQLIYGQAARIIATISEIDANADLTLATIAAQATLNKKSSSIQAVLIGISDQDAQVAAAGLLGPLDVDNFSAKSAIAETLATKALKAKTGSSEFIGVVQSAPELNTQVAAAFAIQQIANGKSCLDTKSRIKSADLAAIGAIEGVYVSLTQACDAAAPTNVAKAIAQEALMGLKVKD